MKIKSNIRGLNSFPGARSVVKNAPPHPSKFGRDKFIKSNSKRKAKVM